MASIEQITKELETVKNKLLGHEMAVRWVETSRSEELKAEIPMAMITGWHDPTYYKLQQYFDGKWNDVEIQR